MTEACWGAETARLQSSPETAVMLKSRWMGVRIRLLGLLILCGWRCGGSTWVRNPSFTLSAVLTQDLLEGLEEESSALKQLVDPISSASYQEIW